MLDLCSLSAETVLHQWRHGQPDILALAMHISGLAILMLGKLTLFSWIHRERTAFSVTYILRVGCSETVFPV